MTSILKADTIQDADGNNIINENSNTITIGASGDTITIPSGATISNSGTASGFGITEADQWRLTANITSNTDPISSNLERNDSTAFAKIGTGMSVSSGYWTFPSTGLYWVEFTLRGYANTNDTIGGYIEATTNNSSYDVVADAAFGDNGANSNQGTTSSFVNVTDTANVKVKFAVDSISGSSVVEGHSGYNRTFFTFIRLGGSQ
jgi:hypothetical protein